MLAKQIMIIYNKMLGKKFQFFVKGPKNKIQVKLPFKAGQFLSDARQTVVQYLSNFYFYDEKGQKEIPKFFESEIPAKDILEISIRFPSKQAYVEPKAIQGKKFIVKDEASNYQSVIYVPQASTLSQIRQSIIIPDGYSGFTFLKDRLEVSQISQLITEGKNIEEKKPREPKVLKDPKEPKELKDSSLSPEQSQIMIKLTKDQKKKQDAFKEEQQKRNSEQNEERQKKLKETEQTSKIINGLILQLDKFEKSYMGEYHQKVKQKEAMLNSMKTALTQLNIAYTLSGDADVKAIMNQLKQKKQQNDRYIKFLLQTVNYISYNLMVSNFFTTFGIGYLHGSTALTNILDFKLTKLQIDNNCNKLVSNDFNYSSEKAQSNHLKHIEKMLLGGSFSAAGGNPFFFVKGGASYDQDQQNVTFSSSTKNLKNIYKNFISLYIGTGIILTEDNIQIKDYVIKIYQNLCELFKTRNPLFKSKAKEFLVKYGDKIEVGTYYFGNTFTTNLQVEFQTEQSITDSKKIAQSALVTSIAGGGLFSGGGFAAAKASFHMKNSSATQQKDQTFSSKYSMKSHTSAYPPVQSYPFWKQVVTKNVYWRIVGKDTRYVSLFKLLHSSNTFQRSKYLQSQRKSLLQKFHQELMAIDDSSIFPEQSSTRQFTGKTFKQIVQSFREKKNLQQFQTLVLKRTDFVKNGLSQSNTCKQYLNQLQFVNYKGLLRYIILEIELVSLNQQRMAKYKNYYIVQKSQNLVKALKEALEKFKNLKTLQIFGRFYLFDTAEQRSFARYLNFRDITTYIVINDKFTSSDAKYNTLNKAGQNYWGREVLHIHSRQKINQ